MSNDWLTFFALLAGGLLGSLFYSGCRFAVKRVLRKVKERDAVARVEAVLVDNAKRQSNAMRAYLDGLIDYDTFVLTLEGINNLVDTELANILNIPITTKRNNDNVSQENVLNESVQVCDNHRFSRSWYKRIRNI